MLSTAMSGMTVDARRLFQRVAGGCEAAGGAGTNYLPGAARLNVIRKAAPDFARYSDRV